MQPEIRKERREKKTFNFHWKSVLKCLSENVLLGYTCKQRACERKFKLENKQIRDDYRTYNQSQSAFFGQQINAVLFVYFIISFD